MAEAGDGATRSGTRRRTEQVRVRMTPEERARIARIAARQGHATAAAYMRAVAMNDTARAPRDRQVIGLLGLVGSWLADAHAALAKTGHEDHAARLGQRAHAITALQRQMMEATDVGEDDPDPA